MNTPTEHIPNKKTAPSLIGTYGKNRQNAPTGGPVSPEGLAHLLGKSHSPNAEVQRVVSGTAPAVRFATSHQIAIPAAPVSASIVIPAAPAPISNTPPSSSKPASVPPSLSSKPASVPPPPLSSKPASVPPPPSSRPASVPPPPSSRPTPVPAFALAKPPIPNPENKRIDPPPSIRRPGDPIISDLSAPKPTSYARPDVASASSLKLAPLDLNRTSGKEEPEAATNNTQGQKPQAPSPRSFLDQHNTAGAPSPFAPTIMSMASQTAPIPTAAKRNTLIPSTRPSTPPAKLDSIPPASIEIAAHADSTPPTETTDSSTAPASENTSAIVPTDPDKVMPGKYGVIHAEKRNFSADRIGLVQALDMPPDTVKTIKEMASAYSNHIFPTYAPHVAHDIKLNMDKKNKNNLNPFKGIEKRKELVDFKRQDAAMKEARGGQDIAEGTGKLESSENILKSIGLDPKDTAKRRKDEEETSPWALWKGMSRAQLKEIHQQFAVPTRPTPVHPVDPNPPVESEPIKPTFAQRRKQHGGILGALKSYF